MTLEQNKAVARRFIEEVLGKGNFELLQNITTNSYMDHSLPSGVTPRQSIGAFRAGFADAQVTVNDVIAEGDETVVRWTMRGTHSGSFYGMPATGKSVIMNGMSMYRLVDGKLAEGWVEYDELGLMQQLGAIPSAA